MNRIKEFFKEKKTCHNTFLAFLLKKKYEYLYSIYVDDTSSFHWL